MSAQAIHVSIGRLVFRVLSEATHAHVVQVTATAQARPVATAKKIWTCVYQAHAKMAQNVMKILTRPGPVGVPLGMKRMRPAQTRAQRASNAV